MSAQDLEQRARELLAAEYEAAGESWAIWAILKPPHEKLTKSLQLAIRAIVAALRQQPAPTIRDRELDRKHFTDASFNEWLDTGISDAGHTVWDAIGDTQAAWAGWDARPFAGDAVMLPECCGREECGGECGNDWLGLRMYRKPTEKPAPVVDDGNGVRACPVLIAARVQGVES